MRPRRGSPSTLPWQRYDVFEMGRCWSAPRTGRYAEHIEREFIPGYRAIEDLHQRLDALDAAGLIHHPARGRWPGLKRYAAADPGHLPAESDPVAHRIHQLQRRSWRIHRLLYSKTPGPLRANHQGQFQSRRRSAGRIRRVRDDGGGCGTAGTAVDCLRYGVPSLDNAETAVLPERHSTGGYDRCYQRCVGLR